MKSFFNNLFVKNEFEISNSFDEQGNRIISEAILKNILSQEHRQLNCSLTPDAIERNDRSKAICLNYNNAENKLYRSVEFFEVSLNKFQLWREYLYANSSDSTECKSTTLKTLYRMYTNVIYEIEHDDISKLSNCDRKSMIFLKTHNFKLIKTKIELKRKAILKNLLLNLIVSSVGPILLTIFTDSSILYKVNNFLIPFIALSLLTVFFIRSEFKNVSSPY